MIDVSGDYVAQLVVNDGVADSVADEVTITTRNSQPVANAGPAQSSPVGDLVDLDGSGSTDVDGDPLTFEWSLTTVPAGSSAKISDPTLVSRLHTGRTRHLRCAVDRQRSEQQRRPIDRDDRGAADDTHQSPANR